MLKERAQGDCPRVSNNVSYLLFFLGHSLGVLLLWGNLDVVRVLPRFADSIGTKVDT